jgi:hypothetical protein
MTAVEANSRLRAGGQLDFTDLEAEPQDSAQRRRYLLSERQRLQSLLNASTMSCEARVMAVVVESLLREVCSES